MLVPTKRFWGLVALGVPIAALGGLQGQILLPVAYDLTLVLAAYVTGKLGPSPDAIKLKRKFDAVLSVRAENTIKLELENVSAEPIQFLLRDEPPPYFPSSHREFRVSLKPGAKATRSYTVIPKNRGSESFRGSFVRIACPLGLVVRQERLITEEPLRVYPNVLALREFDLLQQKGRLRELGIRQARMRGLGTDFESLREYTDGDDYRKIDWKASARRGKLVVKQFETERNQSVIIAIDVGRHMLGEIDGITKLDHALDSCLMLAQAAALAGDQVGLFIYADHVIRYIPPRKGRNQVGTIVEALHDVVALPVETDLITSFSYLSNRWKRRALIVNFTDSGDADRARELGVALRPLARRHLVLLARISDPRLKEVLERTIACSDDMYAKAAGYLIDEDRRQATSVLTTLGLQSLESEPQDLAANLVSFYFRAKERALI